MKRRLMVTLALALLAAGMTAAWRPPSASAKTGASYDLSWHTLDGGGGTSSGGSYSLAGGAGQPATGESSGTGYQLSSGFWVGGIGVPIPPPHKLYLPLVVR